jgi:hypothetical protein
MCPLNSCNCCVVSPLVAVIAFARLSVFIY